MSKQEHTLSNSSRYIPWTLFVFAIGAPFLAWISARGWSFAELRAIHIYPLLGLWAWCVMWTHYVYGALRVQRKDLKKNPLYSKVSEYVVLACLILHPGILAWNLWRSGDGLPPLSYMNYVGQSLRIFVFFGSISLFVFLSYEYFQRVKEKPAVVKNWKYISATQMMAMILIFFHGIQLGQHFGATWFRFLWINMGALLIPVFTILVLEEWLPEEKNKQ